MGFESIGEMGWLDKITDYISNMEGVLIIIIILFIMFFVYWVAEWSKR